VTLLGALAFKASSSSSRSVSIKCGGEWESRTPKLVKASRLEREGLAHAQTRQFIILVSGS